MIEYTYLFELSSIILFCLAIWHFKKTFPKEKLLLFFIPAVIWGYIVELTAIYLYHIYYYPQTYFLSLFGVPIAISLGWATATYIGLYITTKKFHIKKVINVDIDTAIASTILDFIIIEPIAFFYKFWVWQENDFWFQAPLFNFVGWFLVITIFMLSYNYTRKNYKDTTQQIAALSALLLVGLIILELITILYKILFGWF